MTLPAPLISERAVKRFIKMPAPTSSTPLANGWPVDRTMMLLASNSAQLALESGRQLVFSLGHTVPTVAGRADMFSGIADLNQINQTSNTTSYQNQYIPWDRQTACRFGPFYGIADATAGDGNSKALRPVRCYVDYTCDTSASISAGLFFAMTSSKSPSDIVNGSFLAFGSATASFGHNIATVDLIPTGAVAPIDYSVGRCRNIPLDGESVSAGMLEIWIWFGWAFIGSAGTNKINSMNAFEMR